MTPLAIAAAAAVLVGMAMSLRASNGRLSVAGLGLTLIALPLAAGGTPELLVLAFRTVALLLAVFILDHAVRRTTALVGPIRLGGTAETGLVAAGFVLGALLGATIPDPRIPAIPLGTAVALLLGGGTLIAFAADTLRLGIGCMLLVAAGAAIVPALGGRADAGLQLALAGCEVAIAGAVGWLAIQGAHVRHDLELANRPRDLRDAG